MHGSIEKLSAKAELQQMARDHLRKAKNDTTKAISAMADSLLADRRLLKELVAPIVLSVATTTIGMALRHVRGSIVRAAGRAEAVELAHELTKAWLDFPLRGGLKLRDASKDEILAQVDFYHSSGSDMLHKARWLAAIAKRTPSGKHAGDVLTEEQVGKLWQETSNA